MRAPLECNSKIASAPVMGERELVSTDQLYCCGFSPQHGGEKLLVKTYDRLLGSAPPAWGKEIFEDTKIFRLKGSAPYTGERASA